MCGRYTIIAKAEEIEKQFEVEVPEFYIPSYNAAPTQTLPVISNRNSKVLSFYRWGFTLPGARAREKAPFIINTRAETLRDKPLFKDNLQHKRCLIIADGFYEWKKRPGGVRIPYRFITDPESLIAFAGIWVEAYDDENEIIPSFSIITTPANEVVRPLHDRMPSILTPEAAKQWLDPGLDPSSLLELLKPLPGSGIIRYPVSKRVNSIRNNDPELLKPAPPTDADGSLFLFE